MTALPLTAHAPGPDLRPYQVEARTAVYEAWDRGEHALVVLPTGCGKTLTALSLAADVLDRGGRVVWLAHRSELLTQPLRTLGKFWPHHRGGIVKAARDDSAAPIVFASVDTLRGPARARRLLAHGEPTLVVVDEAHHSPSPTHRRVLEAIAGPGVLRLGLSATPDREDGADLSEHWTIAYAYDLVRAIHEGYLAPPYAAVARLPNLPPSAQRRDIDDAELGRELLLAGIASHTVSVMADTHVARRLPVEAGEDQRFLTARGRQCLVFTASVEQAVQTAAALTADGWRARWLSGETPEEDRRRLLSAFMRGQIDVLCNAILLTEGSDLPPASCVVLARPFRGWGITVQAVGRGLRLYEGKTECLVLDLAGATEEHSLLAAPVLVGGDKCKESPNGIHEFAEPNGPIVAGAGAPTACIHCDKTRSCWPALQAGIEGHHVWYEADTAPRPGDTREYEPGPDGTIRRCRHCERVQCLLAADGRHRWAPVAEGTQSECMWCEHRIPDPHAALVGGSSRLRPIDECAGLENWLGLPGLEPETFAVVVPDEGILFVGGDRHGADDAGAWIPHWLPHRARKPRRLSLAPIPTTTVRAWADDIVRRAARAKRGSEFGRITDRQREYAERLRVDAAACGSSGELAREIDRARARERAIATGIARDPRNPTDTSDDTDLDTEQHP